ncbi:hypothetical protein ACKKBG_A19250 [Auxenochlorella protothecoides x Auxenochlorella symbiontica]
MFFGPTIVGLRQTGASVSVLCLSTGNAAGLGPLRQRELFRSCAVLGVPSSQVTCIDDPELQDGSSWQISKAAVHIQKSLEVVDPTHVLTFDAAGASGHHNHIATHCAVQTVLSCRKDLQLYLLETFPLWQKYSPLPSLAGWASQLLHGRAAGGSAPKITFGALSPVVPWRAMTCHSSQLVWYRYLWLAFSVYMVYNRLRVV